MSTLNLICWDVQHGSAIYIRTPNGLHFAIDLGVGSYGASNNTFSPLSYLKNRMYVQQLNAVIITHPHRDHLDDIFNFDSLSPLVLYHPWHLSQQDVLNANRSEDESIIYKYLEINQRYNQPIPEASSPFSRANNGGLSIKFYSPQSCSTNNINNHSIVTIMSFAGSKVLIPGDNEPESWSELLAQRNFVEDIRGVDILVAPHHGRASGYSSELFRYIKPKLTIISDGRFCDTSATSRYSSNSFGLTVDKRSGGSERRNCVTTRNDGFIEVELGVSNTRPYCKVKIN